MSASCGFAVRFSHDSTPYSRFGDWLAWMCVLVSVILYYQLLEKNMILEDLQHRYEGLTQRISLVRSYL